MELVDKDGRPVYGRWIDRPNVLAFDPMPKRRVALRDPPRTHADRMLVRDVEGAESAPWTPGRTTPEGEAAAGAREGDLEQPSYEDYESPLE